LVQERKTAVVQKLSRSFVAGATIALLASCAAVREQVKSPEVSVGDVRVIGSSLTDAQLAVDLVVKNPNAFGISADGVSYALRIQDKPLFDGTTREKVRLEGGKSSKVTLPFSLRYEDALGSVAALKEARDLRYKVSGKIDFGIFTLPYAREGKIALPRLPDLSVQALQISQLSLNGFELALKLKVNNPNGFPIRLDDLNYDVKLAGIALMHGRNAQPIAVKSNKDGLVNLKVGVDFSQMTAVMEKLRNAKSLPIEFTSQVKVPGASEALPYTWSGEVPLVRK
jgi:LEA14-like dessication related protein